MENRVILEVDDLEHMLTQRLTQISILTSEDIRIKDVIRNNIDALRHSLYQSVDQALKVVE